MRLRRSEARACLILSAGALTVQPTETSGTSAHGCTCDSSRGVGGELIFSSPAARQSARHLDTDLEPAVISIHVHVPSESPRRLHRLHTRATPARTRTRTSMEIEPSSERFRRGRHISGRAMLMAASTPPAAPAHNISDVGIGFVTPVLAEDQNITRDPTRGGIGLVTYFDGSQWLPPQNVFLEARIIPPSLSTGNRHFVLGHQPACRE